MILAIEALQIMDVQYPGVANQERIPIYVRQHCDLGEYCLILALPAPEGGSIPVKDHLLWFGNGMVNPGDWIFVYTAAGSTTIVPNPNEANKGAFPLRFINMHWGKEHTIFQNRGISPMLIRIGGTGIVAPQAPAYQGALNSPSNPRLFK